MKKLISKALSGASLLAVVILTACGSANDCPNGQIKQGEQCVANLNGGQMINGQYVQNGYPGQYPYNQAQQGQGCQPNQIYNSQYGCLQQGINGCQAGTGWAPQANQCVAGQPVAYNNQYQQPGQYPGQQYPNMYQQYPQNGMNYNYYGYYNATGNYPPMNTGCMPGMVYTQMYGCLQQGGCGYGMGMGPFGCTF